MDILKLLLFAVVAGLVSIFLIEPIVGLWAALAFSGVCGFAYGVLASRQGDE